MGISGHNKLSINQSGDNSEYLDVFHRNVLFLIVAGHKKLISSGVDYSKTEEEDITGELTKYTNEYIDSFSSPDWTKFYDVCEEFPEHNQVKKGKHRKRIDIVCTLTGRKPRSRIRFEAKRLKNKSHPVGIYLGSEGLGEFIAGNYARNDKVAVR